MRDSQKFISNTILVIFKTCATHISLFPIAGASKVLPGGHFEALGMVAYSLRPKLNEGTNDKARCFSLFSGQKCF